MLSICRITRHGQPAHAGCVVLQARERMRMVASAKRSRALEEKRRQAGIPLAKDDAVTKIQSMLRGHLWRSRTRREANQEQVFIGMKPQVTLLAFALRCHHTDFKSRCICAMCLQHNCVRKCLLLVMTGMIIND